MKDYYTVLGVSKQATAQEIRRAYRKLAMQYHPDKNPDPAAREKITAINEAYDVLGDPEKRRAYDMRMTYGWQETVQPTPPSPAHRDPRYRGRRPPSSYKPSSQSDQYELMKQYLPVFIKSCYAGVLLTVLLGIDRVLPFRVQQDEVAGIQAVVSLRSHGYMYDILITSKGRKVVVYNLKAREFTRGQRVEIYSTFLMAIPMHMADLHETTIIPLGYIYRGVVFFPVILLLTSLGGLIFRRHVHFSFSLSIVSAILVILNLYIIFR